MAAHRLIDSAVAELPSDAVAYCVELRSGRHQFVSDEPSEAGGHDEGPSPFGLLLAGLGACTAITLRMYAERKGWDIGAITIELRYLGGDNHQGRIERTVRLTDAVSAERRVRLAEIAERTPATVAISAGTPIATTFAGKLGPSGTSE